MANTVCDILLTQSELELMDISPDYSAGAMVDFRGIVRDLEDDRKIDGIDYEAHAAMAEHQLRMIGERAVHKFGLKLAIIHHRIGFVPVGKSSLLLRVAARNRAECFEASRWMVDELKSKVPIWKHPRFKVGEKLEATSPSEARMVAQR